MHPYPVPVIRVYTRLTGFVSERDMLMDSNPRDAEETPFAARLIEEHTKSVDSQRNIEAIGVKDRKREKK